MNNGLLWPTFSGPGDLAEIERIPLSRRGLPASTYELVTRAASLWPDRLAVSVLADAERFHTLCVQTFADLAGDVHRTAAGDQVQAVLIAGEVEIHVPGSTHDDEVRAALSQYAWTWKLTS